MLASHPLEFIYVPPNDVAKIAAEVGGTPYDINGVEFGHVGERCSFGAIVRAYDISRLPSPPTTPRPVARPSRSADR